MGLGKCIRDIWIGCPKAVDLGELFLLAIRAIQCNNAGLIIRSIQRFFERMPPVRANFSGLDGEAAIVKTTEDKPRI